MDNDHVSWQRSAAPGGLRILPVRGMGQVRPGDDLAELISAACADIADGDVLVVTSKIVSKAEGRLVPVPTDPVGRDAARRALIDSQTVRLVAQFGRTKIVENPLGLVATAAGVDSSNVPADVIALLPADPDRSAAQLVADFARRGRRVGVVITDTQGRAWREGVQDIAIGAAGLPVLDDHRGKSDVFGNELGVTNVSVGDEIAAAADLVKGKLAGVPVAVLRGLHAPGGSEYDGGGQALIRRHGDLFRLGTDLALEQGRAEAVLLTRNTVIFCNRHVPVAVVDRCVRAALGSANPDYSDLVQMVLVQQRRAQLLDVLASGDNPLDLLRTCPEVLAVAADPAVPRFDIAMLVDTLLISLAASALGTCWHGPLPAPALGQVLDLPPGYELIGVLALGFPTQPPTVRMPHHQGVHVQ